MSGPRPVALEPLILRLGELLRQCGVLHGDETPVEQVDPGRGKTKRAYLWAWRSNALGSDPQIVYFDEQPGRGGKYAVEFLAGWEGTLMDWLFAGSEAAGQRAAALQSLRETARPWRSPELTRFCSPKLTHSAGLARGLLGHGGACAAKGDIVAAENVGDVSPGCAASVPMVAGGPE